MQKAILFFTAVVLFSSCALTSSTRISANNSFLLGNNEHGSFSVRVKNTSSEEVNIYHAPIDGGSYSPEILKPYEKTKVNVRKNTALVIQNKSNNEVSVELVVKGDLGLSMGYKN